MKKEVIVWLLNQTQPSCGYYDKTIGVFANEVEAIAAKKSLNREYRDGKHHYYTIEAMELLVDIPDY
ncbi:MAG: hypothetical protein LBT89_08380 [Planctomycetaceae bacterium]|jgi:hypothetical protein|nr:hypothetical protein [Planctomycetaceae bacterium]